MSATLKPCPFCGGKARLIKHHKYAAVVRCTDCESEGPDVTGDEVVAASAWNQRVTPPELLDALKGIEAFAEEMVVGASADAQAGNAAAIDGMRLWSNVLSAIAKARIPDIQIKGAA